MTTDGAFARLLATAAARHGDRPAISSDDGALSFGDLHRVATEGSATWAAAARPSHPPVVVLLPSLTSSDYARATVTALVGGAVLGAAADHTADPMLTRLRPDLVVGRDADVAARTARAGARSAEQLMPWGSGSVCTVAWPSPEGGAGGAGGARPSLDRPSVVMGSSGTTGRPRLVAHTADQALWGLWQTNTLQYEDGAVEVPDGPEGVVEHLEAELVDQPGTTPRFFSAMPPGTTAWHTMLTATVFLGREVVPGPSRFDLAGYVRDMRRHRPTTLGLHPLAAQLLLREAERNGPPVDDLLAMGIGGGPVSAGVAEGLERAFGCLVYRSYGLTETIGPVASGRWYDDAELRHHTVGRPVVGVAVDAPADGGPGDLGPIRVEGPSVADLDLADGATPLTTDGWLTTGDLGRLDEDGALRPAGRADWMIVRSGQNIDPTEVEQVLTAHDRVEAAAVATVAGRVAGEPDIVALVVVDGPPAPTLVGDLRRHCADRLATVAVPRRFVTVDDLPLTADGTPQRSRLGALVGAGADGGGSR